MPLLFIPGQKMTKLGQFKVKDESPSSGPSLQPGSLFFSRDNATKSSTSLKGKALQLGFIIYKTNKKSHLFPHKIYAHFCLKFLHRVRN